VPPLSRSSSPPPAQPIARPDNESPGFAPTFGSSFPQKITPQGLGFFHVFVVSNGSKYGYYELWFDVNASIRETSPEPIPSTTPQRFLFMDLDGVLNPFRAAAPPVYLRQHWIKAQPPDSAYKVWANPAMGAALMDISQRFSVQIVWATTWVDYPSRLNWYAAQAGLPTNLPRISQSVDFNFDHRSCGKLPGVSDFLRKFPTATTAWVDDSLGIEDLAWATARGALHPTLAIKVEPTTGLTAAHIGTLIEFFEQKH
jgi:hypothetical protein